MAYKDKEKERENKKKYYQENKEKIKKREKEYHQRPEVKARKREYQKKYYKKPEVIIQRKEYLKRRYLKKKRGMLKYQEEYYQKNKEKESKRIKKWGTENPEKMKHYNRKKISKRRALRKKCEDTLTNEELKIIMHRDKNCIYCGSNKNLGFEHIISLNKDGENSFLNGAMACRSCNSSKKDRNVFEWCKSKGYKVPKIVVKNLNKLKNES